MPVISTNIAANSAVRYLNVNSADQTSSLSKLASGSRISQASDDAAGLAISTRITSDVTTLTQAATNASHGISVLQTADGGAANISDILQRMKALASQSASGTVTDNERTYIDAEFSQLTEEINGISESTRYNGQSLLDGSSAFANGVSVMVGSDASDTITVSIAKLTAEALGITAAEDEAAADLLGGTTGFDASAGDVSFKVNGTTVTLADDGGTNSDGIYSADDIADAINAALGSTSTVTASVDSTTGALTLSNSATGSSSSISLTDFRPVGLRSRLRHHVERRPQQGRHPVGRQAGRRQRRARGSRQGDQHRLQGPRRHRRDGIPLRLPVGIDRHQHREPLGCQFGHRGRRCRLGIRQARLGEGEDAGRRRRRLAGQPDASGPPEAVAVSADTFH